MRLFIFVEDTYGVVFHREALSRLLTPSKAKRIVVRRMPAKKCNPALRRKIAASVLGAGEVAGVIVVIDSEGGDPGTAAREDVLKHFEKSGIKPQVVVAIPMHEA